MKKTRFTEEQMVTILREADEKSVPEVAKKHGVSSQTIYGWRKHFGSLEPGGIRSGRVIEVLTQLVSVHGTPRYLRSDNGPEFVAGCAIPFAAIQGHGAIDHSCGIAGDASADAANQLQNRTKNNFCATGAPAEATWTTYKKLQANTDALPLPFTYGSHSSLPDDRSPIRATGFHTTTNGDDVHEGRLVRTVAFLLHGKYSNTGEGEGVNCGVSGVANNDIHLALVKSKPTAATNECNSITAEISPHFRPLDWLILASLHKKGTKTAKEKFAALDLDRPMRFTGQVMLDGSHKPCTPGQPRNPTRTSRRRRAI